MSFEAFKKIDFKKELGKTESELELEKNIRESKCSLIVKQDGLRDIKDKIETQFKNAHQSFNSKKESLDKDKNKFDAEFKTLEEKLKKTIEDNIKAEGLFKDEIIKYKKKMTEDIQSTSKILKITITYDKQLSELSKFYLDVDKKYKKLVDDFNKEKKEQMGKDINVNIDCEILVKNNKLKCNINKISPSSNKIYITYTTADNKTKKDSVAFNTLCAEKQSGGGKYKTMRGGSKFDEINTDDLC
jgi:hypothetical protein